MTDHRMDVDVAVIGASVAGCTAAHLLGRAGLRVALVEKHADPQAYKRLCGHYIQSSATPVLQRLGIAERMEAAGAVRHGVDIWTRWGWIRPRPRDGEQAPPSYSLRRSKLDPLLREHAARTPGVTYLGGHRAVALLGGDERCDGVVVRDRDGDETAIRSRLVVGADGRASATAELAGETGRARPNNRFCAMAYYDGIEHRPDRRAWLWMLEPDVFIAVPNDQGLTLLAAFVHRDRLAEFKADRDAAFAALMRTVPEGPAFDAARRVSPFLGYSDYPSIARRVTPRPGLALVGDAALTSDATLAIGCGWALQSATWLVDATLPALRGEEPLTTGLRRYRRVHRRRLAGHARMLDDGARAKPPNPIERLMLSAAARDAEMARHFERFASRSMPVRRFLAPAALARAACAKIGG